MTIDGKTALCMLIVVIAIAGSRILGVERQTIPNFRRDSYSTNFVSNDDKGHERSLDALPLK